MSSPGVNRSRQVSILVEPPPKQLLFPLRQRDHYLLGDTHSLTQKNSQSSHNQSYSLETENYELARFLKCVCEEKESWRWPFIG